MFALFPVIAKIASVLFKCMSIISLLISMWQFTDFANTQRKFSDYQSLVSQAKATGDAAMVSAIPAVAAPDVTQWAAWLVPGLLTVVSWMVSNWIKNPNLKSVLQGVLKKIEPQNIVPDDASPAKPDGKSNQGPPADELVLPDTLVVPPGWKLQQLPKNTLFSHLEAIVGMIPSDGSIHLQLVTDGGVTISVQKQTGKEVVA